LTSVTLPYLVKIAAKGIEGVAKDDPALAKGLSTLRGELVSGPVVEGHDLPWASPEKVLSWSK
jgi:alanine dehydrogenase